MSSSIHRQRVASSKRRSPRRAGRYRPKEVDHPRIRRSHFYIEMSNNMRMSKFLVLLLKQNRSQNDDHTIFGGSCALDESKSQAREDDQDGVRRQIVDD